MRTQQQWSPLKRNSASGPKVGLVGAEIANNETYQPPTMEFQSYFVIVGGSLVYDFNMEKDYSF